ncbi:MAG: ThuA domain-containing protein [Bacillota bacterium]
MSINVLVWNEFRHEQNDENVKKLYPFGIHVAIADFLGEENDISVSTATLDDENHGITAERLENTDVLIWWGHGHHEEVSDEVTNLVSDAVLRGMGLIVLHSGHFSKPFKKLMGTTCSLMWRDADRERLWCVAPGHPIAQGVPLQFELENEEMYGETFDIPEPDELVYIGWFKGGEVFRSGCCFRRGLGKIFYFQPGHEQYPIYYNDNIQKVMKNAVRWAKSPSRIEKIECPNPEPLER